jgi:hypothetical protein
MPNKSSAPESSAFFLFHYLAWLWFCNGHSLFLEVFFVFQLRDPFSGKPTVMSKTCLGATLCPTVLVSPSSQSSSLCDASTCCFVDGSQWNRSSEKVESVSCTFSPYFLSTRHRVCSLRMLKHYWLSK